MIYANLIYAKAFFLTLGLGMLVPTVAQARPQVDGSGLISPDQSIAIVNFGPGLATGKYTYYKTQSGGGPSSQKRMGTAQIYSLTRKSASGTFEEYSVDGKIGCQGSLSLEVTTPSTARSPEIRLNARWEIQGAIAGKQCDRVGQTTAQKGLRWGRLPQASVGLAAGLGSGTLTAEHRQTRINLRDRADLAGNVQSSGGVGDRIRILNSNFGSDQYLWYRVELVSSGAKGWVRGDWVSPDFAKN
ncbi:MAG: hypothetical protein HC857_16840 [Synechococcales cyanobacterium RU_4_20]|nr:hypothetical protein [Synechococcales cyanobacterium RU_4_20]NJR69772.1 hypothetical protein [Synechococcales cyanobacterium CRU_2_2]